MNSESGKLYRRKEAASYIRQKTGANFSEKTLAKKACVGGGGGGGVGPRFRKFGRIPIYTEEDLDEWIESKFTKPVRSTSELEAA